MFRAQTHQVFICLALSRLGPQGQLARQISRCFWVLDHPFEFALPHLPCTLRFGLTQQLPYWNLQLQLGQVEMEL